MVIDLNKEFEEKNHTNNAPENNVKPIDAIIKKCLVDYSEHLTSPPVCIEFISEGKAEIIGTLGNFSAIIGKAKSRKTYLVSMIVASAFKGAALYNTISAKAEGKKIIVFDTEQSRHKVQQIQHRIVKLSGKPIDDSLQVYALRSLGTEKRIEAIERVIYETTGLSLVVIDGIRDLVHDINNPEEATSIQTKLLKWTEERNIHIITVIHQNKGDNNARGHLGTEIVNKAETTLSVTKESKNKDISIVEAEYCREKDFQPFAFTIDENGLPSVMDNWVPIATEAKKKLIPQEIQEERHQKILTEIFNNTHQWKYIELVKEIKNVWANNGLEMGDNKAKDYLTYYINCGLIEKSGGKYNLPKSV